MAFVTKVWKDRLAEFAGRRKLINVPNGTEMTVDVTRQEGQVSQAGDAFSAANMNNLEQRIKNEFDSVNSNLGDMGQLELLASNTSNVDKVFSITNLTNYRYVLICYMSSDDTICTGASIVPVSLFRALTSQFMTRFNGSSSTHEKTYGATAKYISDSSIALRVIAQESGYESRLYGLK